MFFNVKKNVENYCFECFIKKPHLNNIVSFIKNFLERTSTDYAVQCNISGTCTKTFYGCIEK